MLHFIFSAILLFHAIIHLLGFAHELQCKEDEEFSYDNVIVNKRTEKIESALWLTSYALFLVAVILFMLYSTFWWMFAGAGVLLSQILIFADWKEAKYGTITNAIILLVAIFFLQIF